MACARKEMTTTRTNYQLMATTIN